MAIPSSETLVFRAQRHASNHEPAERYINQLLDEYFLNRWERNTWTRTGLYANMGPERLNFINRAFWSVDTLEEARVVNRQFSAIDSHNPITFFDPYLTLIVAIRESRRYIYRIFGNNTGRIPPGVISNRQRLPVPIRTITNCRRDHSTTHPDSGNCGSYRTVSTRCYNDVLLKDTYNIGGLDNLGSLFEDWITRSLIPPGFNSGNGAWQKSIRRVDTEGNCVFPAILPQAELLIAYSIKLFDAIRVIRAACTHVNVTFTPFSQLNNSIFRRFITQVGFAGPYGHTALPNDRRDCDRVINQRRQLLRTQTINGRPTQIHYIPRNFRDDSYGIRTVLNYLRHLTVTGSGDPSRVPTLLELQDTFVSQYRTIYCRIALKRFKIAIVRAIEASTLEHLRLFDI
ncbi:hypothetical protein GTQ40_05150 [Flavobacteriaceae bacterium R38]|nr:hypothetical protein [Flavobacteriaceae bacterium R38]